KLHVRNIRGVDKKASAALRLYGWPGNIRELENVIEHAFIIETSDLIKVESLPEHIQALVERKGSDQADSSGETVDSPGVVSDLNYPALKEKFEKEFLIRALKAFDGRINQTAEHTQMTKVTLLRKLEKYS